MSGIGAASSHFLSNNLLPCITISFILGSSLALHAPFPAPTYFFLLAFIATTVAIVLVILKKEGTFSATSCVILFFIAGIVHTNQALDVQQPAQHIRNLISEKTTVTVVGNVATMVTSDSRGSRFDLDLDEILIPLNPPGLNTFQPTEGRIQLRVYNLSADTLQPGTKIIARAVLQPVRSYGVPGAFDYSFYMLTKKIFVTGWIKDPKYILPLQGFSPNWRQSIVYGFENLRQHTAILLQKSLPKTTATLYQALLIGDRSRLPPKLIEQFQHAGTMHLLAISGLHLGLLGSMTSFLLIQIGKKSARILHYTHLPTLATTLTFPLLLGYSLLAGMNTPVLRALVTALLIQYALLIRRRGNLIHLVAAAALIIIIANPLIIATASFQLSFTAVISIILILPALSEYISRYAQRNQPVNLFRIFVAAVAISFAATLGTLPVGLFHFNRVSLIGPLMTLLLEPLLCLWALPAGLVAIPLSLVSEKAATLVLHIGSIAISIAEKLVSFTANFSFASLHTITPYLYEILLYYCILLLLGIPSKAKLTLRLTFSGGILLILSLSFFYIPLTNSSYSSIHFLDIGKGNSVIIEQPDGHIVLIDTGGARSPRFNTGKNLVVPFLCKQRIRSLDTIIISHPDADHFNGISSLLERYQPKELYINGQKTQKNEYNELLRQAVAHNIALIQSNTGDLILSTSKSELRCLGMNGINPDIPTQSSNDRSLVVLYKHGKHSFLFPGDISEKAEKRLIEYYPNLKADLLMASHHGSNTSSNLYFLQKIAPKTIIISNNKAAPSREGINGHIDIFRKQTGANVLITAQDGTVTCRTDGNNLQIKTYRQKY